MLRHKQQAMDPEIAMCDGIKIWSGGKAAGRTFHLQQVRQALSFARAFTPREMCARRQFFIAGEAALALFDPEEGEPEFASRCLFAAASTGVLAWLIASSERPDLLKQALLAPRLSIAWAGGMVHMPEIIAALRNVVASLATWFSQASMWPLFALLALLAQHLAGVQDHNVGRRRHASLILNGTWATWLESGKWQMPYSLHAVANKVMVGPPQDVCSVDLSAALVARCRSPEVAIKAVAPQIWKCLSTQGLVALLEPQWAAFWHGLDRLTASRTVVVSLVFTGPDRRMHPGLRRLLKLDNVTSAATFSMELLPPHILGVKLAERGFWFLADRIRFHGTPRCNPTFVAVAEAIAARKPRGRMMHIVDVGAHLGDCCLWVAARWGERIRCLAVEGERLNAEAIRKSVRRGGFHKAIEVQHVSIVGQGPCRRQSVEFGRKTVDCVLGHWRGRADFVSLYLGAMGAGDEWNAMQGALRSLGPESPWQQPRNVLVRLRGGRTAKDFAMFVDEHRMPYNVVVAREGLDVLLVHRNSSLAMNN